VSARHRAGSSPNWHHHHHHHHHRRQTSIAGLPGPRIGNEDIANDLSLSACDRIKAIFKNAASAR
jgi:hypothetical protein